MRGDDRASVRDSIVAGIVSKASECGVREARARGSARAVSLVGERAKIVVEVVPSASFISFHVYLDVMDIVFNVRGAIGRGWRSFYSWSKINDALRDEVVSDIVGLMCGVDVCDYVCLIELVKAASHHMGDGRAELARLCLAGAFSQSEDVEALLRDFDDDKRNRLSAKARQVVENLERELARGGEV